MNPSLNPLSDEQIVNVGARLATTAERAPDSVAVAAPLRRDRGKRLYEQLTFRELDEDSNRLAAALHEMGATPGTRLVLLVRPGIDFISLTFAMFKAGIVVVLIDPGMGGRRLIRCLEQVEPDGFVAIPAAHAVRTVLRRRFPKAALNVTVGRRWCWGGPTLEQLRSRPTREFQAAATQADDPAAIIFTTGSTGPPKGVLYRHGNFNRQADEIRDFYGIRPGEVDLAAFPLFALFNGSMGVTTIIPEMDATRPAEVDPRNVVEAIHDWSATQAFGSPAFWNAVGRYCEDRQVKLPTLRRVLSAGAPVPPHVLRRMKQAIHPDGDVHTPYGATEALPVASISASEVLGETEARSRQGGGVCVGRKFPGIQWKVIRITEDSIAELDQIEELPHGEIGELIVRGPVVTREYVTRLECNPLHKIRDGDTVWHRMGDVGYLEAGDGPGNERFWFCGRESHRVLAAAAPMYTIPCEAIFNEHERVYRSALVGVGRRGLQRPVVIVEPWPDSRPRSAADRRVFLEELHQAARAHPLTDSIRDVWIRRSLPVDIRHNAKIFREQLAEWAARKLGEPSEPQEKPPSSALTPAP